MSRGPRLTLFTPTYNSVRFIARVWDSVQAQTCTDFEWLVVDDGSTDGTVAWLVERKSACRVPMAIVTKPANAGLLDSYHVAVAEAKAPLLLAVGHDDAFDAHAVATFLDRWEAIPSPDRTRYAGVWARCRHADGRPLDPPLGAPWLDARPVEAYFVHGRRMEMWPMHRTELVRRHLPPRDIDRFVPESATWRSIGERHLIRHVDDVLRTYYRDNPDSLMNNPRVRWPRGRAYAHALRLNLDWDFRRHDRHHFRSQMVSYARYALDAGLTPRQAAAHLRTPAARRLFWLSLPTGALAAANDRRLGRLDARRELGDWSDPPRPEDDVARAA